MSHPPTLISKVYVEEGGEQVYSWKVAFVCDRKAPCVLTCVPTACRGVGDTVDDVWHGRLQHAHQDWLRACMSVLCLLDDRLVSQGFAGMWAGGSLPWLFVVPEAGRAWSLMRDWFQLWVHTAMVSSRVMGSSMDVCCCELQNKMLGCPGTWKEELTQLSGKQFKYFLSHWVPRCWSLALVPYWSVWSAVGICGFTHPMLAGYVLEGLVEVLRTLVMF